MSMAELFHTSPAPISNIDSAGRFDDFLFFSATPYSMSVGECVTYKLEIDGSEVIEARQIFYHEDAGKLDALVAEFCARFGIDEDTAEEIIAERDQLENHYDADSDDSYDVQLFTARAAKILGFAGVEVADEQGASYMISMSGRLAALEITE